VRFEHIMENGEDASYSQPVQFNVKNVLSAFEVEGIRETTLDGNAWLDESRRLQFVPDPEEAAFNTYATFSQPAKSVHLLSAEKPLLGVKYAEEALPAGRLGAQSNRIKREVDGRSSKSTEGAYNSFKADIGNQEYIIELSPMEIRTFIVYLAVA